MNFYLENPIMISMIYIISMIFEFVFLCVV